MIFPVGASSQSVDVMIVDDTGLPVTSLVAATFPTLTYSLAGANADVAFPALSDLAATTTAWAAGGVKERGNGVYRLDLPNGIFTTAGEAKVRGEATGKHVLSPWIDVFDAHRGTCGDALPSVAAAVSGGLPTLDSDLTIGSKLKGILGTLLTETTSGWLAAAFKKLFNIGAPTLTTAGVDQTGDSFARIGAAGVGLTAVGDTAGTTTLLSRLTAARSGYLDNLNVGGVVASHADVQAINTSSTKHLLLATVGQFEPGETYTIEMRTFAALDGSAVNADTTPTLTATGQVSGSLNANLSAATNAATGVYRWTYTPGATPTLEQIRFDGSVTINTAPFTISTFSQTVDFATAIFTSTDKSNLTAIFNKLPAGGIADEAIVLAAIGAPMQAGTAVALTAAYDAAKTAAAPGAAMTLTAAERAAVANSLLDLADAIETGITLRQSHRAALAALVGKLTTAGANPEVYQNPAGTATRVSVANDASGNRSAVTLTL